MVMKPETKCRLSSSLVKKLRRFFIDTMAKNKKKIEFSKSLLIQESILIWIITVFCLALAVFCVMKDYTGTLPWFASMIALPWGAYGVSQACYYNKAKAENTKNGIKYDATMAEINAVETEQETSEETKSEEVSEIDLDYGL